MEDSLHHGSPPETGPAAEGPRSYALRRLNVMTLPSVHEKPQSGIFETEFHVDGCEVASVVIHTCLSANNRQSAHGWLFESAQPDLDHDRPVAELAITTSGEVSVRAGCPSDYDVIRAHVVSAEAAVTHTPTHELRVGHKTASRAIEAANDAQNPDRIEYLCNSEPAACEAQQRGKDERGGRWLRASVLGTALIVTSASVLYLGHDRSSDRVREARTIDAAVPPLASTNMPPDPASPESRPLRELQADPAFRESYAGEPPPTVERWPALTHEPQGGTQAPKLSGASARASPEKTKRAPSELGDRTGAPRAIARAPVAPAQTQATRETLAVRPSAQPGSEGATRAPAAVIEEPRAVPRERVALYSSGAERLRNEQQAQCVQGAFIVREICKERLRWSHCHPDKWDQVPECRVQRFATGQ